MKDFKAIDQSKIVRVSDYTDVNGGYAAVTMKDASKKGRSVQKFSMSKAEHNSIKKN